MNITDIKFLHCEWTEIQSYVVDYLMANNITIDSFWEGQVLDCNHYIIKMQDHIIGYFSIHESHTIWLYHVLPEYSKLSQELFEKIKKYEQVTSAMVTTGDEFFLSHCLDNFMKIEKQAYFSIYTDKEFPLERKKELQLKLADVEKDIDTLKLSGDFLNDLISEIQAGADHIELYIVEEKDNVVGFGVIDYGRIISDSSSTGMYVCESYRMQGYGANILHEMHLISQSKGYRAHSGCWYYNHNSKKTMESAGAYIKTRLIKFHF